MSKYGLEYTKYWPDSNNNEILAKYRRCSEDMMFYVVVADTFSSVFILGLKAASKYGLNTVRTVNDDHTSSCFSLFLILKFPGSVLDTFVAFIHCALSRSTILLPQWPLSDNF